MQSFWIILLSTVFFAPGYALKCYQCANCFSEELKKLQPEECSFPSESNLASKNLIQWLSTNNLESWLLQDVDNLNAGIFGQNRATSDPACVKVTYKNATVEGVIRDCSQNGELACKLLEAVDSHIECYTCNTDGCNGGSSLYAFSLIGLILSISFVNFSL